MLNDLLNFGWIYWDPDHVLFTVPLINRPIGWYGILFASGFIIAYWILYHLFKNKIKCSDLFLRDLANSPLFIQQLYHHSNIVQKFELPLQKELHQVISSKQEQKISEEFLRKILKAYNQLHFTRQESELLFPKALYTSKELGLYLTDRLTWFVVLGTILGARLGHVFFYDWPRYQDHLLNIFKVWEGGLASHGGALGILLSLWFYQRMICKHFPEFTFLQVLDMICIPTPLVGCLIRIGNFFNQEILGTPTDVPWAIIFGHPADHRDVLPRHPTQLYEALAYLIIFFFLSLIWRLKSDHGKPGMISGLFFVLVFSARFFIEFYKTSLSMIINESSIQMGQYLSIPFILLGIILISTSFKKRVLLD